jgi:hypothetical protein
VCVCVCVRFTTFLNNILLCADQLIALAQKEKPLRGSQYDLLMLLLQTLGALTRNNLTAQNKIRDAGILELLISLIGWPAHLEAHSALCEYRREFEAQLLALICLCEAINRNPLNSQRLSALGGNQKIMDLLLWTTEVFSLNCVSERGDSTTTLRKVCRSLTSDISTSYISMLVQQDARPPEPPAVVNRPLVREVARILNVLLAMCVGVGHYSFLPEFREASDAAAGAGSTGSGSPGGGSSPGGGTFPRRGGTSSSPSMGMKESSRPQSQLTMSGAVAASSSSSSLGGRNPAQTTDRSKAMRVTLRLLLDLFNEDMLNSANNRRVRQKLKFVFVVVFSLSLSRYLLCSSGFLSRCTVCSEILSGC